MDDKYFIYLDSTIQQEPSLTKIFDKIWSKNILNTDLIMVDDITLVDDKPIFQQIIDILYHREKHDEIIIKHRTSFNNVKIKWNRQLLEFYIKKYINIPSIIYAFLKTTYLISKLENNKSYTLVYNHLYMVDQQIYHKIFMIEIKSLSIKEFISINIFGCCYQTILVVNDVH